MTSPEVTAVVPTHNRPVLMREAVLSIVEQTFGGYIEILVVFDACEPILPDIQMPANRSIRALVNDRTRGLAGSRNTGILSASGDYVAFLDDDDSWLPTKLERQLAAFELHPQTILVGTAMVVDDGKRKHERLVPVHLVTRRDLLQNRLAGLHSSSFLFRRAALLGDPGLVDEQLPRSYGEDYDLLLRTAAVEPIVVVNNPLVAVRWQGQSFFFGRWALYADALRYLLVKHPDFADSRKALARIQAQVAFALAASNQKNEALSWARRALKNDKKQIKAVLAIFIAHRIISSERVTRVAQHFGKGI